MELFKQPNFNFVGTMKWAILLSLVLIAAGAVSLAVQSLNWGVEFVGGTLIRARFNHLPSVAEIRKSLETVGQAEATIQQLGGGNEIMIRVGKGEESEEALAKAIRSSLYTEQEKQWLTGEKKKFDLNTIGADPLYEELYRADPMGMGRTEGARDTYRRIATAVQEYRKLSGPLSDFKGFTIGPPGTAEKPVGWDKVEAFLTEAGFFGGYMVVAQESVGPSVGRELRGKAYIATVISLLAILVYVALRFEWIYGVGGVLALFHDAFITIGFFSITQKEFNLTIVAAVLTIIGFSINDTIVLFDRVRDNLKIMRRESFKTILNTSINQTLSRTVLTSGTVFCTIVSLYFLGGPVINGFAFAMLIGVVVGSYSTIWIAGALVITWVQWRQGRERAAG